MDVTPRNGSGRGRPSWDEYFSRIAREVASRSTCLRRSVGAVLVRDKRILATGYNGAPRGLPHCEEAGCLRERNNIPSGERHELCRGLHAEMNAIIQAATYGIEARASTLYTTTFPCSLCAKILINAGVDRIVAQDDYADALSKELLLQADVTVCLFDVERQETVPFPLASAARADRERP
jgi:dCMP deaminase